MNFSARIKQLQTWGVKGVVNALRRWPHERSVARFLKKSFVKNAATVPQKGITIIAPISGGYSLSKTMRDFIIRLRGVGIPCQVFDTLKPDGKVPYRTFKHLLTPKSEFNILKYDHIVEMFTSPIPSKLPVKRCRIAFWERENGILDTYPYLKDSDVVIAMSDFNAAYFQKELSQEVKVCKLVYPLMLLPVNAAGRDETRRKYGFANDDFLVFYNFDLYAFRRKNPDGLIRSFALAFRQCEKAKLVMKTNHADLYGERLQMLKALSESLGVGSRVCFINEYLSSEEIYELTGACDVYASLHRGEGFGLGIAEAMQMGKPVVVTAYSAPLEFCDEDTSLLVPYKLIDAKEGSLPIERMYNVEPDVDAAAKALRRLYDNQDIAAEMGKRGRAFVERHFSDQEFRKSVLDFLNGGRL